MLNQNKIVGCLAQMNITDANVEKKRTHNIDSHASLQLTSENAAIAVIMGFSCIYLFY